jgi:hypothetical protein
MAFKKKIRVLPVIMMLTMLILGCGHEQRYLSGRDTVKSFGDGRYQILRFHGEVEVLYDLQTRTEILRSPLNWEKYGNQILVTGNKGLGTIHVQIDLRNNQIEEMKAKGMRCGTRTKTVCGMQHPATGKK